MNIALRFRRGAGLQLAGNTKTQPGYLKVTNARTDQGDVVSKRPGAIEVSRSTSADPADDIDADELRAIWYRNDEGPVLETENTLYSRRMCDSGSPAPSGDWVERGPWARSELRTSQVQDWGGEIVTQSTAAAVSSMVDGVSEPCVLSLAELPNFDFPVGTANGIYAVVDSQFAEVGGLPEFVRVDPFESRDPHVAAVRDDLLAFTYLRTTGAEAGELRYQFWQPNNAFATTSTGLVVGAAPATYDLTGTQAGDGNGYYGLVALEESGDIIIQVRREDGVVIDQEVLVTPGAVGPAQAVAIYGIPDATETNPQFVVARVVAFALSTGIVVDVFEATGSGLVFRWQATTVNPAGTDVTQAMTVGATLAEYKDFATVAIEWLENTTGEHRTDFYRLKESSGTVTDGGSRVRRNALYSSMLERNGILMCGLTAISTAQKRFLRSGLFVQRALTTDQDGGVTEVVGRIDFGLPEDFVSRAARTQVSDTNRWDTRAVIGYQVETDRVVVLQSMGATRVAVLDFKSSPNRPALLQESAVSAHAGYPRQYDGVLTQEQDWHELPQILSLGPTDGALPAGSVGVAVTWAARDGNTVFYRSQPDFQNIVLAGGTGLEVTARPIQRTERYVVDLEVWRTLNNGSVYRLAATVNAKDASDADLVIVLNQPDSAIDDNEILDQVIGGTRPSQPTSITDFVAQADGRLWGPDPFRGALARFTIPASEGFAPHWPLVQGVEVEGARRITAAGAMDGRLVLFTRREAHQLTGAGPSATGVGGFGLPRLIPSAVGCSNHETVALTPDGLVYGSGFTPFILSRSLVTMEYADAVYAPYEIDGEAVRVAVWRPNDRTTVLANGPAGRTLVFSPETLRWEEDTGRQALDLAVSDSREVAWLLNNGRILVEPSVVAGDAPGLDGALGYQLLVSTPWLHWPTSDRITHTTFNFHGVELYGTYQGPHELQVRVYINYQTDPTYELLKSKADIVTNAANGLPYLYHFLLPAAIACYAVRIEISDNDSPAPTFMLEGIDVEVVGTGDNKPALLPAELGLKKA